MKRAIHQLRWLLCSLGVLGLANLVPAQPTLAAPPSVDDRIAELQRQLAQVSEAISAEMRDAVAAKARRQDIDARIAAADARLATASQRQTIAQSSLDDATRRLQAIERGLRITQDEIARSQAGADSAAQQIYVSDAAVSAVDTSIDLADLSERISAAHYLQFVQRQQFQALARQRQALRDAETQATMLSTEQRSAADLEEQSSADRASAAATRDELTTLRVQALAAEQAESAALAKVQAQKTAFERELAQAKAESDAIAAQLQQGSSTGSQPGRLLRPVTAGITSPFGRRVHPIFGIVRMHDGIDFGSAMGAPIKAAGSGTVIFVGVRGGYGNVTMIDHGGGLVTLYAHQSRMSTRVGAVVRAGDVIGAVGSTGNSTGPHLHFEVRVRGIPTDPARYL